MTECFTLTLPARSNSDFADGAIQWSFVQRVAELVQRRAPIGRLDLSQAVHLKPYVIALAVAACERLKGPSFEIEWPVSADARSHLDRMALGPALGLDSSATPSRPTNIPLEVLTKRPSEQFAADVVTMLERESVRPFAPGEVPKMADSIDELILNALTHSESPIGCVVAGQAFPQRGLIEAVIVDLGITIHGHLSRVHSELTDDASAIRRAVEEGVTGTVGLNRFQEPNSGIGLAFVRDYVEKNGGELAILSGKALATFGKTACEHTLYKARFPGTLVNVRLRTT